MENPDCARILEATAHRPYALPPGKWVMYQSWHDLLFAHWPVPSQLLTELVPPCVTIDQFEGSAWIGVVPFRMTNARIRGTAALPWLSRFPELNVRTYVTVNGRPGVYFFSLDAANPVAVEIARAWYHLPYFTARMTCQCTPGDIVQYRSRRTDSRGAPAELVCNYRPRESVTLSVRDSIEAFVTERYSLLTTDKRGRLYAGEIHHQQWPLQIAEAEFETNTMAQAAGITLPATKPLLHFSKRLDVLIWPLRRCE